MIELVNVPFGSIMRAPLALGQIKAQLTAAGIAARTHNVNFLLAKVMGFGAYETIARFKGVETQVSEWLFARAAWQRDVGPDEEEFLRLCGDELETIPNVPDAAAWLRKLRRETIDVYLDKSYLRLVHQGVPRVVAFSCMFFQTVAALALGRRLKERHPDLRLVYGGACFHGEAGEELADKVPWIDVVATGEADEEIVPLFAALERGQLPTGLPGVLVRDPAGRVVVGPPARIADAATLEALPDPDYTEFFEDAGRVGLLDDPVWLDRASLPFEASRGCWWGQKKHCTFCGLNGEGMEFRVKRAERVLATLEGLAARYPTRNLQATDNIMAMSYWKTFLPALAAAPLHARDKPVDLFFEIKPNLTRAQIKALADANVVYVQPGIESLSSHLLQVIDKGVTALQNVFFLKCATEYGILPIWNILIRIPGERAEDYAEMAALVPRILHLRPPTGGTPRVECHRYSPYFHRTGVYIEELRPARWYRGVYPEDEIDLGRVAYYFDAVWKDVLGDPAYDELIERTHAWMRRWGDPQPPRLTVHDRDGRLELEDTRGTEAVCWQLEERQARIYRCLADITTPARIAAELAEHGLSADEIRGELLGFVAEGLAIREHDRFLGLALPPTADVPLEKRVIRRMTNQRPARAPAPAPRGRLPLVRD